MMKILNVFAGQFAAVLGILWRYDTDLRVWAY